MAQKRRNLGQIAVTLVALLALTTPASSGGNPWRAVRKQLAGVPCRASAADDVTKNLKLLATEPFGANFRIGELDIRGDLLVAHVYGNPGGLVTFDISNPLKPRRLGQVLLEGDQFGYDVKLTDDGSTAVIGYDFAPSNAGLAVVDVRNPKSPKVTGTWESDRPGPTQNSHMVYVKRIAGEDWVFVAPNESTGAWIFKIVGKPGKKTLEYVTQTLPVQGGALGPHDIWVGFDKELETWVLYTADGFHGWLAFDVSDPASPQLLGGLPHPSTGYTHTIQAAPIKGKRIVATVEEVGVNFLELYDASDLSRPVPLGSWAQGGVNAAAQHNFQMVGKHLFMAHYGNGLYVFDLAAVEPEPLTGASSMEPMARYDPAEGSFWDVVVHRGLLYMSDFTAGGSLHVLGFGCLNPGDLKTTSTG